MGISVREDFGERNWGGEKGTFSRGNLVSIPGKESRTPAGVLAIGQVLNSWLSNACAPSLAVAASSSSRFSAVVRRRGLGSSASRSPRSNVYGVGFWTMTGSLDGSGLGADSAIVAFQFVELDLN